MPTPATASTGENMLGEAGTMPIPATAGAWANTAGEASDVAVMLHVCFFLPTSSDYYGDGSRQRLHKELKLWLKDSKLCNKS